MSSLPSQTSSLPKHRQVYESLHTAIQNGEYGPGDRLPSEVELGRTFGTSRITIAKAVNELQKQGLVSRRAGSGTHVLPRSTGKGHVFGLLIPDFGRTEIFEPICHGMMRSPISAPHSLLWGYGASMCSDQLPQFQREQEQEAEQLCHQYISQKVAGVFFSPLEHTDRKEALNRRIIVALERAKIPVVLLDRCIAPYPDRSPYDLVGIDNHRAGFVITSHLLKLGCRDIVFLARPRSAPTVDARAAGWRDAYFSRGLLLGEGMERRGDPEDRRFIEKILHDLKPEAFVCANDITAAQLMQTLQALGVSIPDEIRIVGIDDVKYAGLLPVPLTTQHQNCADIGVAAMAAMLGRIAYPQLPPRDILLQTHTMVRESCGSLIGPMKRTH